MGTIKQNMMSEARTSWGPWGRCTCASSARTAERQPHGAQPHVPHALPASGTAKSLTHVGVLPAIHDTTLV